MRDGLVIGLTVLTIGVIATLGGFEELDVRLFIIAACVIYLLVTILYYIVFMQPYRKRVLQQNADMESGKIGEALEDIQTMQQEPLVRRSRYLTQCCQINQSAAYCRMEQYDRALEILKAMPEKNKGTDAACPSFEYMYLPVLRWYRARSANLLS